MDHPAALHRLKVGVPATVEHSSEAGPETGKWVAETTQVRPVSFGASIIRLTEHVAHTELHHVHGCAEIAHARQGPATSDLTGACHGLCPFQREQGLGRPEQND